MNALGKVLGDEVFWSIFRGLAMEPRGLASCFKRWDFPGKETGDDACQDVAGTGCREARWRVGVDGCTTIR